MVNDTTMLELMKSYRVLLPYLQATQSEEKRKELADGKRMGAQRAEV